MLGCGVPADCPIRNFNFNYSHDGAYVVGACEPTAIVGVDIAAAQIKGANKDVDKHFSNVGRCMTKKEWDVIKQPASDHLKLFRFATYWALKESYVKATGWGLGVELDTLEFRNVFLPNTSLDNNRKISVVTEGRTQTNWFFRVHVLDNLHIMAVATGPATCAAPTFKATFSLPANDPLWQANEPSDPEIVHLSVEELIEGIPEWEDK